MVKKMFSSGHTVAIYDEDTPEMIALKIASAQYIIDMRTDITEPLEFLVRQGTRTAAAEEVAAETPKPRQRKKKPKYRFNI